ncbi:hypothetical protein [uncultured Clostridium sp.]|jgi:hypothetical protein|uniref:hypothetical protein n=1 Tax=uncultured Clostridium sp. TaxID=59620 RepID=UPI0026292BEE|nr:hypothetical protein [uncultured Clostridium sp.]
MSIATVWSLASLMLILFAISGATLFYKNGRLAKDIRVYIGVVVFAILLAIVAYISMPGEFYIDRLIAVIGGIAAISALVIKQRMFFLSKIILIVSMSVNMVIALI